MDIHKNCPIKQSFTCGTQAVSAGADFCILWKLIVFSALLFMPAVGAAATVNDKATAAFTITLGGGGMAGIFCLFVGILIGTWWLARRKSRRERLVMDKLPLRYFVADTQGTILLYALGDDPALFHGKLRTLDDLSDQKVNQLMAARMPDVLKTGKPVAVEFEFNHQRRTALISPLPVSVFRRPAAIWISQNTTELLQTRDTAEANAARLKLTLTSIGDGVLVTDRREVVTMANPVATRLLGIPERNCAAGNWQMFLKSWMPKTFRYHLHR